MRPNMKILIHGLNSWPELIGVGKYTGELAFWLAERGHDVRVVTAYPYYPQWRIEDGYRNRLYAREEVAGVRLLRCPLWVPRRQDAKRRMLHLLSFAASSAPVVWWQALTWRPDVVIGVEPAFFAAPATVMAAWLGNAASWLHIQDFEIDAAFGTGLVSGKRLQRWSVALEAMLLRRFDQVSTISAAMCERLKHKGVPAAKIALVPNWAATDEIRPLAEPSPLRRELGIAPDTLVALYAGNMSEKQGLEMLAAAAVALRGETSIRFVFAGEGAARHRLETMCAGLPNVQFLPLQPTERLNDLLNLADIHLLPQRRGVADLVMPSKLLGMLASGRPVVAGADAAAALGAVVASCGVVVAPEDGAAMADAIAALARDPGRRAVLGEAGRRRVIAEWGKNAVLMQLERRLVELCPVPRARGAEDGLSQYGTRRK
jgi:colanic acid biosynthesis glycosyl transferase WcaI